MVAAIIFIIGVIIIILLLRMQTVDEDLCIYQLYPHLSARPLMLSSVLASQENVCPPGENKSGFLLPHEEPSKQSQRKSEVGGRMCTVLSDPVLKSFSASGYMLGQSSQP